MLEKNGNLNLYWAATSNKPCIQTLFYLSFRSFRKHRQARSARKKNRERPSVFFFPHPYPLLLAVNKSPEIYIFNSLCIATLLPSVKVGDRAPSPSFYWGLGGGVGGVCAQAKFFTTRARRTLRRKWRVCEQARNSCRKNGKLNLYWASTSIKRSRPPFCRSIERKYTKISQQPKPDPMDFSCELTTIENYCCN